MIRTMEVNNEEEAREWCDIHGYTFNSCYLAGNYILEYDDGKPEPISDEEQAYIDSLENDIEDEPKGYVIYSERYGMSTLYKGPKPNEYVFDIKAAKLYTKTDAEKKAKYMTKHSKSDRIWHAGKY